jgi:YfiH family protein
MQEADVLFPHWPGLPANVATLATTRHGGVSALPYDDGRGGGGLNLGDHVGDDPAAVAANRAQLAQRVPYSLAWISQVHGVNVVDAAAVGTAKPEADASIATSAGAACIVMTADCLPVLFADANGKVVGAAHAGWRGLAAGVLGQTVAAMRAAGAGEIMAWLGPAIGPRQFEVGQDVAAAFSALAQSDREVRQIAAAFVARGSKYHADIYALARCLLARDGVGQIAGGDHCTVSEAGQFYSYRRDGRTGRQASLIWLK